MTISGGIHGGIEVEFNPSGLLHDGREYFVFEGLFYAKSDDQLVFVGDALPVGNNFVEEVTANLPPQESLQSSESFNLFKPSTWL